MSRIGKLPVEIQNAVQVKIEGNTIMVEGPKGKLSFTFSELVEVKQEENTVVVTPK
jgi:large subunit ribosomal protein L6